MTALAGRLRSWLRLDAFAARPLIARADQARDGGRFGEAGELYGEALALTPRNVGVRVQYAHMLKETGRLDEAEQQYRRVLEASPGDADLVLQLGHLYKFSGRPDAAAEAYRQAGAMRPGWSEPERELAALSMDGWCGAPPARTLAQAREAIEASGLFDPDAYWKLNRDIAPTALTALDHFLMIGARDKRRPHILFDVGYYLQAYPDVARAAINPLDDFVRHGRDLRRNPNPYFDTAWYMGRNPDVEGSGLDPISHYIQVGAARRADPSPSFDARFYVESDPDVFASGLAPLAHYLLYGRQDGRKINAAEAEPGPFRPVAAAAMSCRKSPIIHPDMALFVTHAGNGDLKPHVGPYLAALRRQGIATVLIVAVDGALDRFTNAVADVVDGLFVRDNLGYDFAAWAHVLDAVPALYGIDRLYLLNDSLFGPTNDEDFRRLIARARGAASDLVGITECYERAWHIQSYFLLLNRKLLGSDALKRFMGAVVAFADKDDVIDQYECKLASRMKGAGFTCETLFEAGGRNNATIFRWRCLLEAGFPFVKVRTIRDRIEGADATGWREALNARGYDTRLVDQTLQAMGVTPFAPDPR